MFFWSGELQGIPRSGFQNPFAYQCERDGEDDPFAKQTLNGPLHTGHMSDRTRGKTEVAWTQKILRAFGAFWSRSPKKVPSEPVNVGNVF